MALTPFQDALLVVAGLTGCLNTFLQVLRSRARRQESEERRKEIAERRAFELWLYDHGKREKEAHDELVDALRSATPAGGTPKVRE